MTLLGINTLDNHQGNHTHSHAFLTLKSLCFDDLALATTMRPYLVKFKHSKNIRKCFEQFFLGVVRGLDNSEGHVHTSEGSKKKVIKYFFKIAAI